MKLTLAKTRGMGLSYGENFVIQTLTVFLRYALLIDGRTKRQADGRAIAYTLIVTLAVSAIVFEILTLKARKWLIFPTPSLFEAPLGGNP